MADNLVSIVIAARNAAQFVAESINSLLVQSHKEIEVLVVDDFSLDTTADIVSGFKDSRVRLLRLSENLGQAAALAHGISKASGRWIARQDADDFSSPHRIRYQLALAEKMAPEYIFGCSARVVGDRKGYAVRRVTNAQLRSQMAFVSPFIHSSIFSRRENFVRFPYDPTFTFAQDFDWLDRAVRGGAQLFNLPLPLVSYRVHSGMKSALPRLGIRDMKGKVFVRIFEDLQIQASSRELDIHFAMAVKDANELGPDVTPAAISSWSAKILGQNAELKVFNSLYLGDVVGRRSKEIISQLQIR